MGALRQFAEPYSEITCCACGLVFVVPTTWEKARRSDGKGFNCPNGHSLTFGETEVDRLRKQLSEKERSLSWALERASSTERRLTAAKGETTKLRKRIANGVCPDCHRHFTNLERHIASKHTEPKA
jgi:hypothetical protein